jgi:drug/metabolite transporter (DMT)-like permease
VGDARRPGPIFLGGLFALSAALCFGLTVPLVKRFGHGVGPFATAALLYAGAALGSLSRTSATQTPLGLRHTGRLLSVAIAGAFVAPVCLAWGLARTSGAAAALVLNFEGAFTLGLAALVHREPIGARVALAAACMVAGGAMLVHQSTLGPAGGAFAVLAVALATFAWAVDNTLTQPLSELDTGQVVRAKCAIGSALALAVALWRGELPVPRTALVGLLLCGAAGYGVSLRLYLLAQRRIGAGRTGSIFALAPFVGAGLALLLGEREKGPLLGLSALLFAVGAWLHLSERHEHHHVHVAVEHEHVHRHDDRHHGHEHGPLFHGEHAHPHRHEHEEHDHPHAPDVHHRHRH